MELLTKIEHLESIKPETKTRYLEEIDKLRFKYMRFISSRKGDVQYNVHIKAGEGREAGIHASEIGGCMRALTHAAQGTERKPQG